MKYQIVRLCLENYFINVFTQVPMVICANKCDLLDEREITKDDGELFAKNANAVHIETRSVIQ